MTFGFCGFMLCGFGFCGVVWFVVFDFGLMPVRRFCFVFGLSCVSAYKVGGFWFSVLLVGWIVAMCCGWVAVISDLRDFVGGFSWV